MEVAASRRAVDLAAPRRLRFACFLVAAYGWLLAGVDPSLTYHGAGMTSLPAFSPDPLFLRDHLSRPGGPLAYAAAWLSQWFVFPAAGAWVLVAVAGGTALAVDAIGRDLAGKTLPGLRYLPAAVLLIADAQYLHFLDWQLGWLLCFAATALWLRLPRGRPAAGLLGLVMLYYLAGGAMLVAALVLALGDPRLGVLWPAAVLGLAALLPGLSTLVGFDRPLTEAYRELALPALRNDVNRAQTVAISLLLPACALLLAALSRQAASSERQLRTRPLLAWGGVAVVLAAIVLASDPVQRAQLRLAALGHRGDWQAVLHEAERLPVPLRYIDGYVVLRALAETGQSGERLFCYPLQPWSLMRGADPRLGPVPDQAQFRAGCGLQLGALELELGFVNEAEGETHESLETLGAYPRLLVPMARIQALKGRPEASKILLRLAAGQPGGGDARALLAALERDPSLATDAQQQRLRRVALTTDTHRVSTTTGQLEAVVAEHPDHRLATEYLFAWYLLTHRLDDLVAALPALPRWGRAELPRHFQEAVVCWEAIHSRPAELGGWRVGAAARERFEGFVRALGCDPDELARLLTASSLPPWIQPPWPWSDTFYFYRLFGTSGAVQ